MRKSINALGHHEENANLKLKRVMNANEILRRQKGSKNGEIVLIFKRANLVEEGSDLSAVAAFVEENNAFFDSELRVCSAFLRSRSDSLNKVK